MFLPSKENFTITIKDASNATVWSGLISEWGTGENPSQLKAGNYTVEATYGSLEEEGFDKLAEKFRRVATVERSHEERFLALLKNVETNQVFFVDRIRAGMDYQLDYEEYDYLAYQANQKNIKVKHRKEKEQINYHHKQPSLDYQTY